MIQKLQDLKKVQLLRRLKIHLINLLFYACESHIPKIFCYERMKEYKLIIYVIIAAY